VFWLKICIIFVYAGSVGRPEEKVVNGCGEENYYRPSYQCRTTVYKGLESTYQKCTSERQWRVSMSDQH
jgi:hypothetical protein